MLTTWRELLEEAMQERDEVIADIVYTTLTEEDMDRKFNSGFGSSEGVPFTAWTLETVYFPVTYDGAEWVGYVPRHPTPVPTEHQGGQ